MFREVITLVSCMMMYTALCCVSAYLASVAMEVRRVWPWFIVSFIVTPPVALVIALLLHCRGNYR